MKFSVGADYLPEKGVKFTTNYLYRIHNNPNKAIRALRKVAHLEGLLIPNLKGKGGRHYYIVTDDWEEAEPWVEKELSYMTTRTENDLLDLDTFRMHVDRRTLIGRVVNSYAKGFRRAVEDFYEIKGDQFV